MPEDKKTKLVTVHAVEYVAAGIRKFAKPGEKIEVDADQEKVLRSAKAVRDLTEDEQKLESLTRELAEKSAKLAAPAPGKTGTGKKTDDVV